MLVFPKGLTLNAPHDKVGLARWPQILITPGAARDRLTAGAYVPRDENDVIGRLEFAMEAVIKADPIEAKMREAQKEGKLPQRTLAERRARGAAARASSRRRSTTTSSTPTACGAT